MRSPLRTYRHRGYRLPSLAQRSRSGRRDRRTAEDRAADLALLHEAQATAGVVPVRHRRPPCRCPYCGGRARA